VQLIEKRKKKDYSTMFCNQLLIFSFTEGLTRWHTKLISFLNISLLIGCGWSLVENPIVSAFPNALSHNDDAFQSPWNVPSHSNPQQGME
jgi:hypothetical protein